MVAYARIMFLGVPLFIVMVGTGIAAWRGDRQAAALLVLQSAVWLYVDKWFEGPILVHFGHDHGLVLADLFAFTALFVAGLSLLRSTRQPDRAY
jgi:hypothetical protein